MPPRDERGESKIAGVLVLVVLLGIFVLGYVTQRPSAPRVGDTACDVVRPAAEAAASLLGGAVMLQDPQDAAPARVGDRWVREYLSMRCSLYVVVDGALSGPAGNRAVFVTDWSESSLARSLLDPGDLQEHPLPGATPGDRAVLMSYELEGQPVALLEFSDGRVKVGVFATGNGPGSLSAVLTEVVETANRIDGELDPGPDLDLDRTLRDELAPSWAGVLVVVCLLGTAVTAIIGTGWLLRVLVAVRIMRPGDAPAPYLGPTLRRRRWARRAAGVVAIGVLAVSFTALVRRLPATWSVAEISVAVGVGAVVLDLTRQVALGATRRYRYLRLIDARAWAAHGAVSVLEGVAVGVLVFAAGLTAEGWEELALLGLDGDDLSTGALVLTYLFGPAVIAFVSLVLRFARTLSNWSAERVLRADDRRPLVLLRSFRDEDLKIAAGWSPFRRLVSVFDIDRTERFEEFLVKRLWRRGPVLALGEPGSRQRLLGAARTWHPMDDWQDVVVNRIVESQLVVVVAGPTPAVSWELEQLVERGLLHKTLIVFPPVVDDDYALLRRQLVAQTLGSVAPWATYDGDASLIALQLDDGVEVATYADVPDDLAYELALDLSHQARRSRRPA